MTTQPGPTANIPSSLVSGGDENKTTCVRTSRPKAVTHGTQRIPPIGTPVPSAQRRTQAVDLPNYSWACRSEEHTSELQSQSNLVCRLLLEKKTNSVYPAHSMILE